MNWKSHILAMSLLLAGAVAGSAASTDPARYPGYFRAHDMYFSWNMQQRPGAVAIEGTAQNTFRYRIYQLQLYAIPLDDHGRPVGKEVAFVGPNTLDLDEKTPFRLTLPVTDPSAVKNIRVEYRFHLASFTHWVWTYGKFRILG